MHKEKFVFAQLVEFLNADKFRHIVDKYQGNRYIKSFTCWNQLLVLMFGQLCNRKSLRDLAMAIGAHRGKGYHLGFGSDVKLSNLSKANTNRDYRIFEEFAYYMVGKAQSKRMDNIFKLGGKVYAFDSTTIDLCLNVYQWARFRKTRGGVKIHTLFDLETQIPTFFHITPAAVNDVNAMDVIPYEPGSFYVFDRGYNDFKRLFKINEIRSMFVVRAKNNLQCKAVRWKRRMPKNVRSDCVVIFTGYMSEKHYPKPLRKIVFYDEDQDREFTFLTNVFSLGALQVALLYKNRWQIELFFKWIKQHLHIKTFYGTSMNAVFTQIWIAICDYLLLIIAKKRYMLEPSLHTISNSIGQILFKRGNIREIFNQPTLSVNALKTELGDQLALW